MAENSSKWLKMAKNGQKFNKNAFSNLKKCSNQKFEENKPALELNFLSKTNWADPDFEVEYLTEP